MAQSSEDNTRSSNSRFFAHVIMEILAIVALAVYFHTKHVKQEQRINRLVRVIEDQGNRLDYIDGVLRGLLSSQPVHVQTAITRELSQNRSPIPKKLNIREEKVRPAPKPAAPPPPPPPNPMESVFNMIGPLMSSLVGGMDEDIPSPTIPSPPVPRREEPVIVEIDESELDRELNEEIKDLRREEEQSDDVREEEEDQGQQIEQEQEEEQDKDIK